MSVDEKRQAWKGRLHIVAPSAPPKICGVGDHTFQLSTALARRGDVLIHCGQILPEAKFDGVEMTVDFDHRHPRTLWNVANSDTIHSGETVFVQYTNFAYGRYGFNPWMAPALARLRRRGVRVVTMFHETFMPASEGWKAAIMGTWQRVFFQWIGRNSDVCFFSVEPWVRKYGSWFSKSHVDVLPVGSNIPKIIIDKRTVRSEMGIPEGVPCFVVFGGTHPSRLFDWIAKASERLRGDGVDHRIVHIGPNEDQIRMILKDAPLIELGIRPEDEVSRALGAADIMMAPFADGASTRRTSLLSGLQHGLCCISTIGSSTDSVFSENKESALFFAKDADHFAQIASTLATDPDIVAKTGINAAAFYDRHFAWDAIAGKIAAQA